MISPSLRPQLYAPEGMKICIINKQMGHPCISEQIVRLGQTECGSERSICEDHSNNDDDEGAEEEEEEEEEREASRLLKMYSMDNMEIDNQSNSLYQPTLK